jgi:hypothetical protein
MSRSPYVTSKESSHDTKPTQLVNSSDNMVQVTAQLLRERTCHCSTLFSPKLRFPCHVFECAGASPSDSGSQVDLHLCQLNSVPPFKQLLEVRFTLAYIAHVDVNHNNIQSFPVGIIAKSACYYLAQSEYQLVERVAQQLGRPQGHTDLVESL